MIRSINDNQTQILKDILALNNLERFDADLTYGNGAFYKEIPKPEYRFDIDDTRPDTITCDGAAATRSAGRADQQAPGSGRAR